MSFSRVVFVPLWLTFRSPHSLGLRDILESFKVRQQSNLLIANKQHCPGLHTFITVTACLRHSHLCSLSGLRLTLVYCANHTCLPGHMLSPVHWALEVSLSVSFSGYCLLQQERQLLPHYAVLESSGIQVNQLFVNPEFWLYSFSKLYYMPNKYQDRGSKWSWNQITLSHKGFVF